MSLCFHKINSFCEFDKYAAQIEKSNLRLYYSEKDTRIQVGSSIRNMYLYF